ncbi:MAG TPA: SRPBCC domain-containing protein [Anaerolineales bacterium]|nr:SRPBCC domain-containing protein [Anaerolineales bacterium]
MSIEFVVSTVIPASPQEVYRAWLNSKGHSGMTGSPAKVSDKVGGEFEAWDGYIHGKNLDLVPNQRIVQAWRTSEFSEDEPDSRIEIALEAAGSQTKLTLKHTGLPPHGGQYEDGWVESYFEPMKEYFSSRKGS